MSLPITNARCLATSCNHRVIDHSTGVGCLECPCRWLRSPDSTHTFNPNGKYAEVPAQ